VNQNDYERDDTEHHADGGEYVAEWVLLHCGPVQGKFSASLRTH
jgi:hypothetical protein